MCIGIKWSHLTYREKLLNDMKATSIRDDSETDKDPGAGLMKVMKSMYDQGDPEMKRMIAKAWTEGQEKKMDPNLMF